MSLHQLNLFSGCSRNLWTQKVVACDKNKYRYILQSSFNLSDCRLFYVTCYFPCKQHSCADHQKMLCSSSNCRAVILNFIALCTMVGKNHDLKNKKIRFFWFKLDLDFFQKIRIFAFLSRYYTVKHHIYIYSQDCGKSLEHCQLHVAQN